MELKVWVDGIQRVVCGVSETTTCQDVVYALAHATGRTGRFTLIERWRNNERLLAPQEHPVKVLMKWGEYSSDVQFILLRSPLEKSPSRPRRSGRPAERSPPTPESSTTVLSPELQRRRSDLRLLEHVKRGTVGVVRGVPQRPPEPPWPPHGGSPRRHEKAALNDSVSSSDVSFNTSHDKVPGVRTRPGEPAPSPSLRFSTPPPYREPPAPPIGRVTNNGGSPSSAPPRRPPPYRDPPPPPPPPAGARGSPLLLRGAPPPPPAGAGAVPPRTAPSTPVSPASQSSQPISEPESTPSPPPPRPEKVRRLGGRGADTNEAYNMNEEVVYNNQYRELLNVVNEQKHQLGSLQADVTKCDAEIVHLEESMREQEVQLSSVRTEASRLQQLLDDRDLEVSELEATDELKKETEAGERMKEESEQLKNRLSVCETDLAQYSKKIRELSESLEAERCRGEQEARVSQEELSELAGQLQQLQLTAGRAEQERARLETEMAQLGEQLQQRQTRVEQLLDELKTVNLESLKMASAEELTKVTEGPVKSGLNRQLIGSPRQLENAVPTSKNPHGVWV